jgi:hypothetical protein
LTGAPGSHNFVIHQGATFSLEVTYQDANGDPINLTGYTARMHVRLKREDTDTLLVLTTENGRIALGGAAGTVTLTVTAADTAALDWTGPAVYDLELISGGGVVTRLLMGRVTLSKEVTR